MNDFLLSILLGIVEGLTEFLPVSSTGHLRIVEALFKLNLHDSFWKMYTIVIQLGAILALPVYFWKRILEFLATFPKGERGDRNFLTHPLGLTIVAFVVTALPSWALTKVIGKNLESLWVISIALLVGGIVMWMVVATGYDLLKTLKHTRDIVDEGNIAPLAVNPHQWVVLAIGFVVSFIVALAVVAWFMRWVRTKGFAPFAVYRIILAIVLLILLMRGSI